MADFGLEADGVEQLHDEAVRGVGAEIFGQEDVNGRFEHEGIVDGDHADLGDAEPARVPAARVGGVHDIVRDEEESLQKLGHPAEGSGIEEFLLGKGAAAKNAGGVNHGHAAVTFPTHGVVLERLQEDEC